LNAIQESDLLGCFELKKLPSCVCGGDRINRYISWRKKMEMVEKKKRKKKEENS
jgi:hypothetical protein